MIIPNQIKEHLKGPKYSFTGTRDKDFRCDLLGVLGVVVTGHDTVRFFIAEKTAGKTLENLRSNKLVTLSVTNVFTSESYQLKGKFLSARSVNEEESKAVQEYIDQFEEVVSGMGFPPSLIADHMLYKPALAIEFVVDAIFDQTPKVGTGKQLTTI